MATHGSQAGTAPHTSLRIAERGVSGTAGASELPDSSAGSPTNACFSANAMQEIMLKEEQAIRKENAKLHALHQKLITNSACALPLVRLSLSLSGSPAQPFPPPPPVPLQTPPSRLATSPSAAGATGR